MHPHRSTPVRTSLVIAAAVVTLSLLGACSSGSSDDVAKETTTTEKQATTTTTAAGTEVSTWAKSFCGSLGTWLTDIQQASDAAGDQATDYADEIEVTEDIDDADEEIQDAGAVEGGEIPTDRDESVAEAEQVEPPVTGATRDRMRSSANSTSSFTNCAVVAYRTRLPCSQAAS